MEILPTLTANSVHAVVTDPPYHLTTGKKGGSGPKSVNLDSPYGRARIGTGFMGMAWDGGDIAHSESLWREVLRVAKPGAHLLAFGGTRTFHRMACAIEDAGWELRDTIMWVYGSGFPKSLDVSKAIDKAPPAKREVVGRRSQPDIRGASYKNRARNGVEGDVEILDTRPTTDAAKKWEGWGTALKPAWEPIIVARKPLTGTVAENVQLHGTGAINIDASRIEGPKASGSGQPPLRFGGQNHRPFHDSAEPRGCDQSLGRWPANVIHDGSDEVLANFPDEAGASGKVTVRNADKFRNSYGEFAGSTEDAPFYGDAGSAARFFYCAKASGSDRGAGNTHPTVKPTELMIYLVRLVTPEGGTVLDPFLGSGTTAIAAQRNGCNCIGVELNPEYVKIAKKRLSQRSLL